MIVNISYYDKSISFNLIQIFILNMIPQSDNIKLLLDKVKTSVYNRVELNSLVEYTYLIALSFLKVNFASKLKFLESENRNLEDIAMDSIIPLFVKTTNGKLGIQNSIAAWDEDLNSATNSSYFISKLIWKRVEQTVTNILKERDPIFNKILKTLNTCISNNNLRKERYFGTVIIQPECSEDFHGKLIPPEEFNRIPNRIFCLKQMELFNSLFAYIAEDTNYSIAIPLNVLVQKIKDFYNNIYDNRFDDSYYSCPEIIYRNIIEDGLKSIEDKIDCFYVAKNKLSPDESEMIISSFHSIAEDVVYGGMKGSLFAYLKHFNKSLTKDIFYSKYHHIMNYLLSNFKNSIAENLEY